MNWLNYYIQALASLFLIDDVVEDMEEGTIIDLRDVDNVELTASYERLKEIDPIATNRIHPNDHRKGHICDMRTKSIPSRENNTLRMLQISRQLLIHPSTEEFDDGGEEEGAVQLEAEKDDRLENCVPSLRYAIQQLIRGVSSSREGVFTLQELERQEIEVVKFMMEVNVMGMFHLIKAALPAMKRRTKETGLAASIAMMSSQAGQSNYRWCD